MESLSQARAQVDAMKVELERKEDIVTRQNVRLQKLTQDYQEMQQKCLKAESERQSIGFEFKSATEQLRVQQTKNELVEAENKRLEDENKQLQQASMENGVLKTKLVQIEHEYNQTADKYKMECETNTDLRSQLL